MERTIAVILSGGQSRRMGQDKAGLTLEGQSFLDRMAQSLSPLFDGIYVSVDHAGRYPGWRELPDLRPGQGPLAGLEAAFVRTEAETVFLTAVDLPFASPALAARLLALAEGWDACIIRRQDGGLEPLFGVYRRSCLPHLSACLDEGRRPVRAMLDRVNCRYVEERELPEFDLERALWNVNTRADFQQAEASEREK